MKAQKNLFNHIIIFCQESDFCLAVFIYFLEPRSLARVHLTLHGRFRQVLLYIIPIFILALNRGFSIFLLLVFKGKKWHEALILLCIKLARTKMVPVISIK